MRQFKLRLVLLMLCCGLATAVSALDFKLLAIEVAFQTTTFWMFVSEAIFGVALPCVESYRRQLVDLLRAHAAALLAVNGSNELIGGGLGNRYALTFAPLSIVQAISSTTTLFVFVFGVLLSIAFPQLGRETLRGAICCKGRGRPGRSRRRVVTRLSMIRQSGHRFSERSCSTKDLERDNNST